MAAESDDSVPALPFDKQDGSTDATFVVEDRKLFFKRTLLSECSPVFQAMFISDFRERDAPEIPLPGKKYNDVVAFFKRIHPIYSAKCKIVTDETLRRVLPLADEYQVETIRMECHQYIGGKLKFYKEELTPDKLILYLRLSDDHNFLEHRQRLLEIGSCKKAAELRETPFFECVRPTTMYELLFGCLEKLEARCQELVEGRCERLEAFVHGPVQKQASELFAIAIGGYTAEANAKLMNAVDILRNCP